MPDKPLSHGWKRVPSGGSDVGTDPNEPDSIGYMADVGHAVYVSLRSKRGSTLVTTTETARPGDPSEAVVELHN